MPPVRPAVEVQADFIRARGYWFRTVFPATQGEPYMPVAPQEGGRSADPSRPAEWIRKPRNAADLNALVARAVTALRRIQAIEAHREARINFWQQKIDDLKLTSGRQRDAQEAVIRKLMPYIHGYVEENRFMLTNRGRRKSVGFPDGLFRWQSRSATSIPDEKEFFREVRGLNLAGLFIRVKEEPNRMALLDESNAEQTQKLTTAQIIKETRPQLATPGTSLIAERIENETPGDYLWTVVDTKNRDR